MSFVFAVDVEDWAQSTINASLPIYDTAERNTLRMLELADDVEAKGTWFILGLFAERFPEVVRAIHNSGHEIACHGYGHLNVFNQSNREFKEDVSRAKSLLEDIVGLPVTGYRAPFFSLGPAGLRPLEVLTELGFTYDSSIFPSAMYRNGIEAAVEGPCVIELENGASLVELPPATISLFGRQWPVAGGGYHRLLPGSLIRRLVKKCISQHGVFVSYFHPYEIDTEEFRDIPVKVNLKTRLHQGIGRNGFESKLKSLLVQNSCVQANDVANKVRFESFNV